MGPGSASGCPDEGIEDALRDSHAIRRFVGIDLSREAAPDATTLLKFRRLLETHGLTPVIFATIRDHLAHEGLLLRKARLVVRRWSPPRRRPRTAPGRAPGAVRR